MMKIQTIGSLAAVWLASAIVLFACGQKNDSNSKPPVDLTGTWVSKIQTPGTLTALYMSPMDATITVIPRMNITNASGTLTMQLDICDLVTAPTTEPFKVTYNDAVIGTMTKTESMNDPKVHVSDAVLFPDFIILTGWGGVVPQTNTCPSPYPAAPPNNVTECDGAVDTDGDGIYGITLPIFISGLDVNAYAGLKISLHFDTTLQDAGTLIGNINFPTVGYIFGNSKISTQVINLTGGFNVAPNPNDVPFTSIKLDGDVPCATVLTHCTGETCVP